MSEWWMEEEIKYRRVTRWLRFTSCQMIDFASVFMHLIWKREKPHIYLFTWKKFQWKKKSNIEECLRFTLDFATSVFTYLVQMKKREIVYTIYSYLEKVQVRWMEGEIKYRSFLCLFGMKKRNRIYNTILVEKVQVRSFELDEEIKNISDKLYSLQQLQ